MAKRYGGSKETRKEFPPTKDLEPGDSVVAIALEQREVGTDYGDRTVVECVLRGHDEAQAYTIWWPRKLPVPPLQTPFHLKRISKKNYELLIPETSEEETELWELGPPRESKPGESNGSKIPAKFQKPS